jgi:hypothetical protein
LNFSHKIIRAMRERILERKISYKTGWQREFLAA